MKKKGKKGYLLYSKMNLINSIFANNVHMPAVSGLSIRLKASGSSEAESPYQCQLLSNELAQRSITMNATLTLEFRIIIMEP